MKQRTALTDIDLTILKMFNVYYQLSTQTIADILKMDVKVLDAHLNKIDLNTINMKTFLTASSWLLDKKQAYHDRVSLVGLEATTNETSSI